MPIHMSGNASMHCRYCNAELVRVEGLYATTEDYRCPTEGCGKASVTSGSVQIATGVLFRADGDDG